MSKSGVASSARRTRTPLRAAEVPNEVQGQMDEMCRDLAVEVKRMRQLQVQADELRTVIRQWAGDRDLASDLQPANRGGRR
jgi:hypothetical protein